MSEGIFPPIHNIAPTLIMVLGLMVGVEHAFEPDHMAAVGTRMFKRKSKNRIKKIKIVFVQSSLVGVFWGPILLTDRMSFVGRFFKYGAATIIFIIGVKILLDIGIFYNL